MHFAIHALSVSSLIMLSSGLIQTLLFTICSFTAYASVISPPGTSATVQGLVAGMDDGLGFSIGALFGGFLYQEIGGEKSFRIFALLALITCVAHFFLRPSSTHEFRSTEIPKTDLTTDQLKGVSKEISLEEKKLTEDREQ